MHGVQSIMAGRQGRVCGLYGHKTDTKLKNLSGRTSADDSLSGALGVAL